MIEKAVICAGGSGTRLYPTTKIINKHFLPIYKKPMIFYSLGLILLSKIKDICIICNKEDYKNFKNLLNFLNKFGIKISYKFQPKAIGIGEIPYLAKNFIKNDNFIFLLGDNFFHSSNLSDLILNEIKDFKKGAKIFTLNHKNPSQYGVVNYNRKNFIKSIIEKPANPPSNRIVTGLYFFDNKAVEFSKNNKFSKRGEKEITSILNDYIKNDNLNEIFLGRSALWRDTGTYDDINDLTNILFENKKRNLHDIYCLTEIAMINKWITSKKVKEILKTDPDSLDLDSNYLSLLIKNRIV